MRTKPETLQELQGRIRDLQKQKEDQESAFRSSVHHLAESLRPENILIWMAGKFVSKWFTRKKQGEEKEAEEKEGEEKASEFKDTVLQIAKQLASDAVAKGIDLLGGKIFR
jgi:hypothetical protein